MTFDDVQEFFKSWGMYPDKEDCDDLNEDVIRQGINQCCFHKMCEDAERAYGRPFRSFVSAMTNAMDDSFYLRADYWNQVEEAFNKK